MACKQLTLTQQLVSMCKLEAISKQKEQKEFFIGYSARSWRTGNVCGGKGCSSEQPFRYVRRRMTMKGMA